LISLFKAPIVKSFVWIGYDFSDFTISIVISFPVSLMMFSTDSFTIFLAARARVRNATLENLPMYQRDIKKERENP